MAQSKKSVLFICLGNICRSPIAEAVFVELVKDLGKQEKWDMDSAAMGSWHVGKGPDRRAVATLAKYNIVTPHKARQIKTVDFNKYDYIFGMDDDNMGDLEHMAPPNSKAKLVLLGSYDPEGELIIRDPYYDNGSEGFEKCYQQCVRCCKAFLEKHA